MRQEFDIEQYDWHVIVWYLDGTTCPHVDEILSDLTYIGCSGRWLRKAEELLESGHYNIGLTYSSFRNRESVMVIGRSKNATECANTMIHERCHLQAQICNACDIDPMSEDAAYLAGDIGGKMYRFAHILLCEGCRNKHLPG